MRTKRYSTAVLILTFAASSPPAIGAPKGSPVPNRFLAYQSEIDFKDYGKNPRYYSLPNKKIQIKLFANGLDQVWLVGPRKNWYSPRPKELIYEGRLTRIPLTQGRHLNDLVSKRVSEFLLPKKYDGSVLTFPLQTAEGTLLIDYYHPARLIREKFGKLTGYGSASFQHADENYTLYYFKNFEAPPNQGVRDAIAELHYETITQMDETGEFIEKNVLMSSPEKRAAKASTWIVRESDGASVKIASRILPGWPTVKDDMVHFVDHLPEDGFRIGDNILAKSFEFDLKKIDSHVLQHGFYEKFCPDSVKRQLKKIFAGSN